MIPLDPAHFAQLFSQLYQPVVQQPAITQQPGLQLPLKADSFEQGAASGSNESSHNRPSRHPQYQDILTSFQTDDELDSTDAKLKMAARRRIYKRRVAQKQGLSPAEYRRKECEAAAARQGLSPTEYRRKQKEAVVARKELSPAEYKRKQAEAAAARQGLSPAEYKRKQAEAAAARQGLSLPEYWRKQAEAAAARQGLSVTEYKRKQREATAAKQELSTTEYNRKQLEAKAAKQGLSVTEYQRKQYEAVAARQGLSPTEYRRKQREATMAQQRLCGQQHDTQTKKRKHDGEEFQIPNDFWDIHLDELDFEALLEENDSPSPTLSDSSTSWVLPDDLDCIDSLFPENFLPEGLPNEYNGKQHEATIARQEEGSLTGSLGKSPAQPCERRKTIR